MISTLVIIMTLNGASGFQPAQVQATAMPAEQCAYLADHPPKHKGWTVHAFCTPGGDPKSLQPQAHCDAYGIGCHKFTLNRRPQ